MTRKLYVHVGPRKTATSTIQHALGSHDGSVVVYPKAGTGLSGPGQSHGHHGLVLGFFGRHPRADADIGELLKAVGDEAKRSDRDVVISAEVLESGDVGAFLRALLPHLGPSIGEVEIVLGLREHLSRAASLYNYRIRRPQCGESRTPDEFLIEAAAQVCYAPFVRKLRRTGFGSTALNYHPSENWVRRFLAHLGFREHQMPEIENKVVAGGAKQLVANLALRKVLPDRDPQMRQMMRIFNRMSDSPAPQGLIFGPEAVAVAEREFALDRAFLRDEFAIELVPQSLDARSGLWIGEADFVDIVSASGGFGKHGAAVAEYARRFVRVN